MKRVGRQSFQSKCDSIETERGLDTKKASNGRMYLTGLSGDVVVPDCIFDMLWKYYSSASNSPFFHLESAILSQSTKRG